MNRTWNIGNMLGNIPMIWEGEICIFFFFICVYNFSSADYFLHRELSKILSVFPDIRTFFLLGMSFLTILACVECYGMANATAVR